MSQQKESSVKEEFLRYAERMSIIRNLSSPNIWKFDSADTYSERLRSNFQKIGELAAINRDMLDKMLYPLLDEEGELSGELAGEMESLADMLLNVAGDEDEFENLDLPVASLIAERLLKDAEKTGSITERIRRMDEQIIVCYSMMNMTERITANPEISRVYRDKGIALGLEMQGFLAKEVFLSIPDQESREIVLTDSRFMTSFFERSAGDEEANQQNLSILDRMMEIARDEFYHKVVPGFDWDYFTFRTLEYYLQCTDIHNARGFNIGQLDRIADRAEELEALCKADPDFFGSIIGYQFVPVNALRCRYLAGRVSRDRYRETLLSIYNKRDKMDFNTEGAYFNVLLPLEIICTIDPTNISARELRLLKGFYQNLSAYIFRIPNNGSLSFLLEYFSHIIQHFIEVPSGVGFEEFVLQCLAAMHPPTYVHSRMVGQITERLAYYLIRTDPSRFIGMPGIETLEDVKEHAEKIVSYTYHAALCHDFGKVSIIDTIFVYGRKLLDLEFNIIKSHPLTGFELLNSHESTREYAEVALGHHKWHDDSRGYPEDFLTKESRYKTIIDLVLCADCLDAATDTVGRSYNRGKDLDSFILELKEGGGTRYAPWLLELFKREDLKQDLEFLLTEGRSNTYQETYNLLKNVQDNG
ncbi:MAG: HD domain-containing protein [Lachnospiraceae bacterium]|nr:HD domain-containing protein [Lachnospiraceae bacterium]